MQAGSCAKVHDSWMWDTVVVIGITCVCVRVCVQFQKLKTNKSAEVENHAKHGNFIFGRRKMARLLTNSEE